MKGYHQNIFGFGIIRHQWRIQWSSKIQKNFAYTLTREHFELTLVTPVFDNPFKSLSNAQHLITT